MTKFLLFGVIVLELMIGKVLQKYGQQMRLMIKLFKRILKHHLLQPFVIQKVQVSKNNTNYFIDYLYSIFLGGCWNRDFLGIVMKDYLTSADITSDIDEDSYRVLERLMLIVHRFCVDISPK